MTIKSLMRIMTLLTALSLAVLLAACQDETAETPPAPPTVTVDSVKSADGLTIQYDVRGDGGRALVFVHCWCCDRDFWDNQVNEFADDYTVVTVDLGGHGESDLGREEWTMTAFGTDVATVVEKLNLDNVVLIGHSMGGAVCIEAARILGDRVVGIVGVDNFQNFGQKFTPEEIESFLANFESGFPEATAQFVGAMFSPAADSAMVVNTAIKMASQNPEMGVNAMRNVLTYDYTAALADMRKPIRTISSDRYPTNVAGNKAVAASFDVRYMPGQGHFPHMEDPETFNRLLRETLTDFWPDAGSQQ